MRALMLALASVANVHATEPDDAAAALTRSVTALAKVGGAYAPDWSPDGTQIAYLTNLSGSPQVWVVAAAGGYPRQVTAFDDPVGDVAWSPDGQTLAYSLSPGGGLNTQIYFTSPEGMGQTRISAGGEVNNFFGDFAADGRFHFSANVRDPSAMDGWLYDPATKVASNVVKNQGVGGISDLSPDGRFALFNRLINRGDNNVYRVELANGKETLLTAHEGSGRFFARFSVDGKRVYLGSDLGRDLVAFAQLEFDDKGKPGAIELLAARDDAELSDFELDPSGERALLEWNVGGRSELEFYEFAEGKRTPLPALPAEIVNSVQFSPDGTRLVLALVGSSSPSDLWVYAIDDSRYTRLTESPHPGVDLGALIRPELRKFKGHDGLELSGWLYLPKDYKAPGAVVLSFHGGPEGQDRPTFRADYQALLSRGIAVFAPNIRGSSGFGKRFVNLDNGELRFDANRDIKSAADFLVAAGVGDAGRLGIMGGSYGGYATLVGLTEFPDTFAAGADLFGMVNFETFFAHTQPWMAAISTIEYGDPNTQADLLKRLSPIHKIDQIQSPTIVLHGANDTNVPVVEAEQVVENLKRRKVPVEYVLFPDEGHGWRKTPNRVRSTVEIVRFFERHLMKE
ncbi:MAG: prolyl oligopeptidase family serine peptidase [Lysobacterales bacterium]